MTRFGNQRVDEDENAEEGTTTVTTITTGSATNSTNENAPTSTVQAQTNTSQDDPGTGTVETNLHQVEATQNPIENTLQIIAPIVESLTPETLTPETAFAHAVKHPPSAMPQANGEPGESGNSPSPSGAPAPPAPGTVAPKPNITTVVGHFSTAFNALAQGLGAATLKLAGAPFSQTPITDVITAVQMMLTAVVNAVAEVAQVPKDLLSMFGVPAGAGARPPLFGAGGSPIHASLAPVDTPLFGNEAQLPQVTAVMHRSSATLSRLRNSEASPPSG